MKPDRNHADLTKIDEVVRRYLPSVPAGEMESGAARVLQHLRSMADRAGESADADVFGDVDPPSRPAWRRAAPAVALAAAATLILAAAMMWRGLTPFAVVETADGSLSRVAADGPKTIRTGEAVERGQTIRTAGAGAMLALADGSRIEMRSQSELLLERADDGVRIELSNGGIIVNAAKQHGHLYVQTKDVMVSVVGTVFLVNAESAGSRVAVIEGEVRVQQKATVEQRATETKLRPGEQVATSPTLAARSVKQEIAWSVRADAYSTILASFTKGMAETAGALLPLASASGSAQAAPGQAGSAVAGPAAVAQASAPKAQFEEASIRLCDPDNLPSTPAGARGGGANSFQMTPGRTHALCLTLATLIRTSYGYSPANLDFMAGRGRGLALNNVYGLGVEDGRRVKGGPDWVRSDHYTVEAVADETANAEMMRGPMLQALLEQRFRLKTHIEVEQIPAFALTVARGGLKMKEGACMPADASPARPVPPEVRRRNQDAARRGETTALPCGFETAVANGPNIRLVGAGARMALGIILGAPVIDRTGIPDTARFNFVLDFLPDESTAGPLVRGLPPGFFSGSPDVPRAPNIFTAVEDQLGLKLEPARAPREFIVIDRVERPSPN